MVDMDGKISYSKIVSVRVSKLLSSAFPNPAKNTLTIKLPNNLKIASGLRVLDVVGRVVLKQKISAMQNNIQLDVKTLPAGRYFVSINNKDIVINQSFVIPK